MKKLWIFLLMVSLMFTSGCWDSVEIEQRLFVTAIAIDINEEVTEGDVNRLIVTFSYPNINTIGKNTGEGPSNFIVSKPSSSIFQAGREFMGEAPFPFYYKHLKIIIFSEDVLKNEELVRHVLDELNRDTKINKRVRILAAEGNAKEVLEKAIENQYVTEGTIFATVRDNKYSGRFTVKSLTDMIKDFDIAGVTLIPRIAVEGDKFVVSGSCILKNYRFLDWLDANDTRIINLVDGNIAAETIDVIHNGELLSFAVTGTSSDMKIDIKNNILVKFDIKLEGYLQGYSMRHGESLYEVGVLSAMEKTIEEELKKKLVNVNAYLIEKKAPLFGVGEHMSKFHPKVWAKVKDHWDEMMEDVKIEFNIDVKIRRTGLAR